ncbi:carbohydrate ABC transporter substrate-binding protein (CUT1 family) [Haloactinopolyspora alba]|uniref:Carbohydrate ABC transporter substrate-binding protein (CUT1 family) n=1 Tax=Haloactinopolyspora alba TaxID=648780 RepID=A0A2P8E9C3_9ACTN|nr:sugar ABC transporter substrate-binding protein [Haloactinopolyspora alba]PSL06044.1 carbohydrate ABC transporter substrate-binding protein (CUT1 family) [Haloactinopolyspora alba]
MSTRRKIAGCLLGAAALALPACGSPSDSASGGEDTVTLVMSNHPWQRGIEPLISDFEEESGISVDVQTFAEQQTRDKIQLNLQSQSSAMDVYMTLPSREGQLFASSGYYEPLDDYLAEAPEEYKADGFSAGAIEGMKVDGETMALPLNVEGPVLYYRTDLFQKWGLTPPKTITDLIDTAAKIEQKSSDITPITLRGQAPALPFTFGPFFHGTGLEWTDEQGTPNFDESGAVEAIEQYATLAREYGPPGVINYSFTESSTLFAQGKAAMELESSNELNSVVDPEKSTVADNVGVAPVPAGEAGPAPTVLSWGLAMSPFSEKKDAAWEFMQWATSPEIQLKLTEADIAPPRDGVATDPAYTDTLDTPTLEQWQAAVADLQKNGNVEVGPVGNNAPEMRKVIGDAIGKVILGDATAAEAADEIQNGLTPLLSEE